MKLKNWVEEEYGRTVWLAKQLGVTQPTCWIYVKKSVPAHQCPRIEELTAGVVTCEEMRPDVRWDVVRAKSALKPELCSTPGFSPSPGK